MELLEAIEILRREIEQERQAIDRNQTDLDRLNYLLHELEELLASRAQQPTTPANTLPI